MDRHKSPNASPERIIALAASAGGIRALTRVISGLTGDVGAALVIVLHLDPTHRSHLSKILDRETSVSVKEAEDGERVFPGNAYVAPPDHHLLVNPDGTLSLTRTEFVHFVRPSADLLFESVAASYGERAIAVVLSGSGVDGASGVRAIRKRGGVVLAQDEASSEFFGMPGAAIQTGDVNRVMPLDEIALALIGLLSREVSA
ncbi:MAG TPA: chemotaxis protein CheB [Gemmatimonadota bacterium]|nr:chemotaxis protein CheB [Gemmatimonadota bacterium]